jgi:dTDP-3-amino-2,3,6-trideoxy-4-keto-D-glucose/dTDP-3-amino-3,4,6-trideoxy-alpha-D-glucose/dTDP-2,6-dideoxy-D-kanosamine transaminase
MLVLIDSDCVIECFTHPVLIMQVPLQNPKRQYLSLEAEIRQAIANVLDSGRYLFGSQVSAFEAAFAQFCGVAQCISVANGTDALELGLRAVGCHAGGQVITVANAGGYTTTACRAIGAVPVYVDVVPDTLTLDIGAAIAAVTEQTQAIVVTHLYGIAVDVPTVRQKLAAIGRTDVAVIEDCAQAHGACWQGQRVGALGTLGTFSFYPTKNLGALGDGGAIVCQDAELAQKLRQLRQYGWSEQYKSTVPYGRNSRLDELQAAILLRKLPHVPAWNERRRAIVQSYRQAAPQGLKILGYEDDRFVAHRSVAHLCIAMHPERDRWRTQLQAAEIMTAIHYPILDFDQPSAVGLNQVIHYTPVSHLATQQIFTIPCFPELTNDEIDYVCSKLTLLAI